MPQTKPNVPIRGLNYLFTFGKHKGKTLQQVINEEPSYVEWCMNERIFVLDDEADEALLSASSNDLSDEDSEYFPEEMYGRND